MLVYHLLVQYSQYLLNSCLKGILHVSVKQDAITLNIRKNSLESICTFLSRHTNTQFRTLLDIVVVDYPFRKDRFEVTYVLLSVARNMRLLLRTSTATFSAIHSVVSCYAAAG